MQKQNEQDFWLLQYQKLIDSQPSELSNKTAQLDSLLGYQFLVNGVVHCLPFLSKLWQSNQHALESIADEDLQGAGVKNARDRQNILKSIQEYMKQQCLTMPSAPPPDDEQAATASPTVPIAPDDQPNREMLAECVVCMENSVYLFCFSFLITIVKQYVALLIAV